MERSFPVRMQVLQFLILVGLAVSVQTSSANEAMVLVADKDSPIENISMLEIRKAYLAISVTIVGHAIRPLRRRDDERLNQVFLQSIMAMSQRSYERRLLSLTLKFGVPRPMEVDDLEELFILLAKNPYTIAYMWRVDADANPNVKTIKVLWQEP